ncbi:d,d-heptose 1,7-bisphosphate phosphatase subfamily, putative [Heliomicrobium modesticaldum Ice1]|uniref:D-glycero-alpha-D-manno-heptose-1,7-bisphosphate 7-phosphatase n=1 Tax=Heliobacterium modesticaldum (strain ATCC 51547 / Ice1) TaxID=498761 RepID=B0THI4_HELMI|nr:D-glycero-beta-D-manno-heptose 1,7-bisphosphate 7-phosphatase [Heliomicrobium modesticaldum]ABZ83422.1 d,d-heptose 1,7-bisphosphate phosphatase subfamily, putative [Heliomicrobium modesticaldum Ice1]
MQAVILVGGLGARLGTLTKKMPKPMMDIGGKPFLELIINNLKRFGIKNILLLVGYRCHDIIDYFQDGSRWNVIIRYSIEREPAGTGGALLLASDKLEDEFLLLNGDTFFDFNILDLLVRVPHGKWEFKVALTPSKSSERYGSIIINNENRVTSFVEKRTHLKSALINSGIYHVRKSILKYIDSIPCSLENHVLPKIVSNEQMYGYIYNGYFVDIGIPCDLERGRMDLPDRKRPAAFLDRDGVINYDKGYVHKKEDFNWMQGAIEAIKYLNDIGYYVIVITNQAGVARGYYTEEQLNAFHLWINEQLIEQGGHIDKFYYCPHHPTEGIGPYRIICDCRKPSSGLIIKAMEEFNIDKKTSFLLGDKDTDIIAGKEAQINSFLFTGHNLLDEIILILNRL